MLILFKPWRKVSDLHGGYSTWAEAFKAFTSNLNNMHWIIHSIDNMCYIHVPLERASAIGNTCVPLERVSVIGNTVQPNL